MKRMKILVLTALLLALPAVVEAAPTGASCPNGIVHYHTTSIPYPPPNVAAASMASTKCFNAFQSQFPHLNYNAEGGFPVLTDNGHAYQVKCFICARIGGPLGGASCSMPVDDALEAAGTATGGQPVGISQVPLTDAHGETKLGYAVNVRMTDTYTVEVHVDGDTGEVRMPFPMEPLAKVP